MTDREIIAWNMNLKDSKLSKEQQAWVYDLIGEYQKGFSFWGEIGTCPMVEVI